MTPRHKALVQTTFTQLEPIADTVAAVFYARLFALDPSLRLLFTTDLEEQGRKLVQMMATAVRGLDNLDALVPAVRALGQRHAGYGVQDNHYTMVAIALLATLEVGLGAAFTDEVREAWTTVYGLLAATMKEGAAEPLPRSA